MGTVFHQENQTVENQTNIGEINFGAVQNTVDLGAELQKLKDELEASIVKNLLDEDDGAEAKMHLEKAINQTKKDEPDKSKLLKCLESAKDLVTGVDGLAGAMITAIATIGKLL